MKRIFTLVFSFFLFSNFITAANVVRIYEIFGGGGNMGAPYLNDYVVLFNSSNAEVNIGGWGLQSASAAGLFGSSTATSANAQICNIPLGSKIPAKGFFLLKLTSAGAVGSPVPTADADGSAAGASPDFGITASATAGKMVLINNQIYFRGTLGNSTNNPTGANVVDFVAYGTTATTFEGTGPTPAPSNTTSIRRKNNGQDTDDNAADFAVNSSPAPLNTSSAPLPIELISFKASITNNNTKLTWQTASEKDNSHFAIERSQNGESFSKMGEVKGSGTTITTQNYQFTDATPYKGINYYRLRQVDFDGTESVSKTVSVNFDGKGQNKFKVYPTLVQDNLTVEVEGDAKSEITVRDLTGRVILTKNTEGPSAQVLNISGLSNGLYLLSVRTNDGFETIKITKQ